MTQPPATTRISVPQLPQTLIIDVTSADISEGLGCSATYCPIALALTRWLREHGFYAVQVTVSHHDAEVTLDWRLPHISYFHNAYEWVSLYDAGRRVAPLAVGLERRS